MLVGMPAAITEGFAMGSGPIFLNELRCASGDTSLLNCQSGQPHGLIECFHSQDVGVRCPGTLCVMFIL